MNKKFRYQLFNYSKAGLLNFIINFILYNFLNNILKIPLFLSSSFSFFSGSIISYLFNSKYTFKTEKRTTNQFFLYNLLQITLAILFSYQIYFLTNYLLIQKNLAWLISLFFCIILNFSTQRKIFIRK